MIGNDNATVALNSLYTKKEKIWNAFVSKNNSNQAKQVFLLIIPNEKGAKMSAQDSKLSLRNNDNGITLQ